MLQFLNFIFDFWFSTFRNHVRSESNLLSKLKRRPSILTIVCFFEVCIHLNRVRRNVSVVRTQLDCVVQWATDHIFIHSSNFVLFVIRHEQVVLNQNYLVFFLPKGYHIIIYRGATLFGTLSSTYFYWFSFVATDPLS